MDLTVGFCDRYTTELLKYGTLNDVHHGGICSFHSHIGLFCSNVDVI